MENWEVIIKNKLDRYESPLPEDGLADFRSRRVQSAASRKSPAPLIWVASLAAAAVIALFAIPRHSDAPAPQTGSVAEAITPAPEVPGSAGNANAAEDCVVEETYETTKAAAATQAPKSTPGAQATGSNTGQSVPATSQKETAQETAQEMQTPLKSGEEEQRAPSAEPSPQPAQQPTAQMPVKENHTPDLPARTGAVAEKALFASYGVASGAGLAAGILLGGGGGVAYYHEPKPGTEIEPPTHYLPLRIGISAGFPISNTVRLVSGAEYIMYYSVFNNSDAVGKHQLAHFIGVPLRLDWTFASFKHLDFYAGAGIEGNFCIASTLSGQESIKTEPYIAAVGTVGAMYRICPSIGLYLEPVATFSRIGRFQDLKTYGTQHPLSVSVSTGLRFTLF